MSTYIVRGSRRRPLRCATCDQAFDALHQCERCGDRLCATHWPGHRCHAIAVGLWALLQAYGADVRTGDEGEVRIRCEGQ